VLRSRCCSAPVRRGGGQQAASARARCVAKVARVCADRRRAGQRTASARGTPRLHFSLHAPASRRVSREADVRRRRWAAHMPIQGKPLLDNFSSARVRHAPPGDGGPRTEGGLRWRAGSWRTAAPLLVAPWPSPRRLAGGPPEGRRSARSAGRHGNCGREQPLSAGCLAQMRGRRRQPALRARGVRRVGQNPKSRFPAPAAPCADVDTPAARAGRRRTSTAFSAATRRSKRSAHGVAVRLFTFRSSRCGKIGSVSELPAASVLARQLRPPWAVRLQVPAAPLCSKRGQGDAQLDASEHRAHAAGDGHHQRALAPCGIDRVTWTRTDGAVRLFWR
jgi:hypothetical protein